MLHGSNFGYPITNGDTDTKYYVPFIRALQYASIFSEKLLNKQKFQELRKDIEALKEDDPKRKNKAGIIDFDFYMNVLITAFRLAVNSTRNYVRIAFSACDFDCNNWVSLEEYLLIVRHVEKRTDEEVFENLFSEHADIKFDSDLLMSFDRFVVTCVDFGLFSEEKQNALLEGAVSNELMKPKFKEVSGGWMLDRIHLDSRLPKLDVITKHEADIWLNRVEALERRIRELDNHEENDDYWYKMKSVLISHQIMMREMARLEELQVQFEDEKDDLDDVEFEEEEEEGSSPHHRNIRHFKTETALMHRSGLMFDPNISEFLKKQGES